MRFTIIRGTDWRGDAYWQVYDTERRITVSRMFYAEVHALDDAETRNHRR